MLKIYGAPVSVHTRKVIVAALIKDLPHEVIPVVPVIPGNPPANWRQLSPTGLIPALSDGDFTVSDSTAICTYLEGRHPQQALYPQAPKELAQVLSLEAYAGEQLFQRVVRVLFQQVFVQPKVHKRPTDPAVVEQVQQTALPEVFGFLDQAAADGWLVGETMTMADVAVASNLIVYQYCGFDLDRRHYARLAALLDRTLQNPAVREALRRELPVVESMGLKPLPAF